MRKGGDGPQASTFEVPVGRLPMCLGASHQILCDFNLDPGMALELLCHDEYRSSSCVLDPG